MSVKIDGDIGVIPIGNASNVAFTPVGGIAATNVQAALQEVDAEKLSLAGGTVTGQVQVTQSGIAIDVVPQSGDAIIRVSKIGTVNATLMATANGLALGADGAGGTTQRLTIGANGNITLNGAVGVPSTFVVGGGDGLVAGLGHRMALRFPGGGNLYGLGFKPDADNTNTISFANAANSVVGSISQSPSAVSYNTSSDYRLKDNPKPLSGSGEFIDALKPKTWVWKIDGSAGVGFIAHEVQEVSPSTVRGEKDGDEMQSMEYGSAEFIANIVAELQSLRRRVAELEAK